MIPIVGSFTEIRGGHIFPEMLRWLRRDHPMSTDPNDMGERSFRNPKQMALESLTPANK